MQGWFKKSFGNVFAFGSSWGKVLGMRSTRRHEPSALHPVASHLHEAPTVLVSASNDEELVASHLHEACLVRRVDLHTFWFGQCVMARRSKISARGGSDGSCW